MEVKGLAWQYKKSCEAQKFGKIPLFPLVAVESSTELEAYNREHIIKVQKTVEVVAKGTQKVGEYRAEDESPEAKIEAKHGLDNSCFTTRHTLQEEKLQGKFAVGDKETIEKAVQDTLE